jgi:hypothetical protein
MEFPEGMTVANGSFTLRALLRGEPFEGLWSAAAGVRDAAAWVTLRRLRASPDRDRILRFSSYGIEAPFYIGAPDIEAEHRDYYFCVVDAAPTGTALARAGGLSEREGARLGVALCDVVASWAAGSAGMVFPRPFTSTSSAGSCVRCRGRTSCSDSSTASTATATSHSIRPDTAAR